jgi:hypothetical protein
MRIHLPSVASCAVVLTAVVLLFVEVKLPAVGIDDSASTVEGSLGVSLEDLSLDNNLGRLSFLLNGGFALLYGAFAGFAIANRRREPTRGDDHGDHLRSGDSVASISPAAPITSTFGQ